MRLYSKCWPRLRLSEGGLGLKPCFPGGWPPWLASWRWSLAGIGLSSSEHGDSSGLLECAHNMAAGHLHKRWSKSNKQAEAAYPLKRCLKVPHPRLCHILLEAPHSRGGKLSSTLIFKKWTLLLRVYRYPSFPAPHLCPPSIRLPSTPRSSPCLLSVSKGYAYLHVNPLINLFP